MGIAQQQRLGTLFLMPIRIQNSQMEERHCLSEIRARNEASRRAVDPAHACEIV
jgi:hypothetical protein